MKTRSRSRALPLAGLACLLACLAAPAASAGGKPKRAAAARPAAVSLPADSVKPGSPRAARARSTRPGPQVTPGSPIADRTTIAPFPVPGDTSRAAAERAKVLNVPREGVTTIAPLPPPVGGRTGAPPLGAVSPPERVDVLPERTLDVPPEYPKAARDAGIQGTVVVQARVGVEGMVTGTRVVRSVPGLDSAAVQSVRRMRFKPATRDGRPVPVWIGVPVRFTLH